MPTVCGPPTKDASGEVSEGDFEKWLRKSTAALTGPEDVVDIGILWRQPESRRQREIRERAERVRAAKENPPVRRALLKAMAWEKEIDAGKVSRADIARREGYSRARVTQIMKLLELDEEVREAILEKDGSVEGLTAKAAIAMAG